MIPFVMKNIVLDYLLQGGSAPYIGNLAGRWKKWPEKLSCIMELMRPCRFK